MCIYTCYSPGVHIRKPHASRLWLSSLYLASSTTFTIYGPAPIDIIGFGTF